MKLTLRQIHIAKQSFGILGNLRKFTGLLTYNIAKMLTLLNDIYAPFDKARLALIEKYGELDEKTRGKRVKNENLEQFNIEIDELLNQEIEVDLNKVKFLFSELEGFSPNDLINLESFIDVQVDEKTDEKKK